MHCIIFSSQLDSSRHRGSDSTTVAQVWLCCSLATPDATYQRYHDQLSVLVDMPCQHVDRHQLFLEVLVESPSLFHSYHIPPHNRIGSLPRSAAVKHSARRLVFRYL
jgi:hypothetical protein